MKNESKRFNGRAVAKAYKGIAKEAGLSTSGIKEEEST